jgi:HSP20 family protein
MGERGDESKREERSVARFDPLAEFGLLRTWSPLRGIGWPRLARLFDEAGPARLPAPLVPAVDVHEDGERYLITVEVPGCSKDDVQLEIQDDVLTIRGEKRSERREKKDKVRWLERSYGAFSRSFSLPANADADRVSASFKDGVLSISVPKREEAQARQVVIES